MEMSGQLHTSHMLLYCQQNSPQYPLNRRLGGPMVSADFGRRENIIHPLLEIKPPVISMAWRWCVPNVKQFMNRI